MERLWYVAYGSNLSRERFRCYLEGGRPEGGLRDYPGCRDPAEPEADTGVLIGGGIYASASVDFPECRGPARNCGAPLCPDG